MLAFLDHLKPQIFFDIERPFSKTPSEDPDSVREEVPTSIPNKILCENQWIQSVS